MEKMIIRDNQQKLYVQLFEILKGRIDSGEWAIGAQIPTEEELCRSYDVSKATVRISIAALVRQGYLKRQQGKGTFVCERVIPDGISMLTSFKENMLDAGVAFSTAVLAQTIVMPTDDLDIKLDIQDDKHVIYIKRLRSVEDEPVLLQETYIPHYACPELLEEDLENNSIHELLEKKYGINITKVQGYISIIYLSKDEGMLLGLQEGSCALLLEQYFYSGDSQITYTRSVKRPDKFRFFTEFDRKQ